METLIVTLTITTVVSFLSLLVGGVIGWMARQHSYETSPQFIFISLHGIPYDGIAMLSSLGWIYYVVIAVELFLWVWFFGYLIFKAFKHISQNNSSDEIGNLPTIAKSSILT